MEGGKRKRRGREGEEGEKEKDTLKTDIVSATKASSALLRLSSGLGPQERGKRGEKEKWGSRKRRGRRRGEGEGERKRYITVKNRHSLSN